MTRDEQQAIHDQYREITGEPLRYPPHDFGQIDIADDDFYAIAKTAIERGKPINWSEYYDPLPAGCVS